ncbi:MAG: TadE/TadG family type IV pilus assembly protein [Elusimicrobiales bacterium]|nr:TadE/TadG family type IV pilus assembly protein [Elusimicrobiales bacterium]HOL62007.1 TadE/TadG family type IV pilus assembly protein [Elusimicrobiales bacterium]HPO95111.1 TadE/TadG family type IV pilus assembly protein [Elusimicrobiales bacterium]
MGRTKRISVFKKAQVTVELLLVLPIFFLMLFFIMEIGLLAHKVIVVNHAAYEIARIGSLLAGSQGGKKPGPAVIETSKLESVKCQIFQATCGEVVLNATTETTGYDPQVGPSHTNEDIIVTLIYPVHLVFPGSNYFLADNPKNRHIKRITVTVRMPVEKPLFQSSSF